MCCFDMPMKLFMMPHTVPNRPTNGAIHHVVSVFGAWPPTSGTRDNHRRITPTRLKHINA